MSDSTRPSRQLFVTGMFRSGTTMLARMLAAHDEMAFASDPFAQLFKSVRNIVAGEAGHTVDPASPLADYYFDPVGIELLESIRACCWSSLPVPDDGQDVASRMAEASAPYSPNLAPRLAALRGGTCLDLLERGLGLIQEVYGGASSTVVGFKEVWTTEFVPGFLRALPGGRTICLVRDPRAVYLSKWKQQERYPLLFMARQWRKLAALAWLWNQSEEFGDRVLVMRYEDLVMQPEQETARMVRFLELDDAGSMLDPQSWTDGGGGAWRQNTSFGSGSRAFDVDAIDRWRSQLPEADARLVESICAPEMLLFGYEPAHVPWSSCWQEVMDPSRVPTERLARWILPHVDETRQGLARSYVTEFMRWQTVASVPGCSEGVESLLCLDPQVFRACHAVALEMEASCSN